MSIRPSFVTIAKIEVAITRDRSNKLRYPGVKYSWNSILHTFQISGDQIRFLKGVERQMDRQTNA